MRLRAPAEFRAIAPDEVVVRFNPPPALEMVKLLPPGPLMLRAALVSKFRLALILVVVKLLSDWLAYDPLLRAKPQLVEFCKQMVPGASGIFMVLPPAVSGPINLVVPDVLPLNTIAPVLDPIVPSVRALLPATVRVPVKFAALEIVWPLMLPEVMEPEIFKLPAC